MGWLLLGLLGLVVMLLAVVLLGRVQFAGRAAGSVAIDEDDQADQDVLLLLAALDPAVAEALGVDDQSQIESDLKVTGSFGMRVRLLGGVIAADETGARLLGWRIRWPSQERETPADELRELRGRRGKRRRQSEEAAKPQDKPHRDKDQPTEATDSSKQGGEPWTLRRVRQLWRPAKRALLKSWSALGLRLRLRLVYGGDDPATTGVLAGVLPGLAGAAFGGINSRRPGSVHFRFVPVFDRQVMAGEVELGGDTRLVRLIWPLVRLAFRPEFRRLWWPKRRRDKRTEQQRRNRKEMTA